MAKFERIKEIEDLLEAFCSLCLDAETGGFTRELLARLARKRKLDLNRGGKEIWAAAIVYVIARLNFLFDPANEKRLTPDDICQFFQTNKQTVANKATQIERACQLEIGQPGLCRQEIVEALSFVELPGGFIVPAHLGTEIVLEFLEGEEAQELERQIAEKERQITKQGEEKRVRRAELNRQIAEQKKKARRESQPALFDL